MSESTVDEAVLRVHALLEAAGEVGELDRFGHRFPPELGRRLMGEVFDQVEVHQLGGPVVVPSPDTLGDYFESLPPESAGLSYGPLWTSVLRRARELVVAHVERYGPFVVTADTTAVVGRVSP